MMYANPLLIVQAIYSTSKGQTVYYSIIALWAVVNFNSIWTCPVCTGLPDNSVYEPDPMVQYVALTRLTYDRG